MASTSASSSVQKTTFEYDVFLSFRGEDTRKTFVDHLYHALHNRGIITYKDDEKIQKGEKISEQLIRCIEESRFYIIVFSKNYASSSWCLDELVHIMDCQKTREHTAYPVFFDVEPTEVRHQSGAVGEALKRFIRKRKRTSEDVHLEKEEDVGRWRNALKEAGGLDGWELKNTVDGNEKFIQNIVEYISLKPQFNKLSVDGKLVGMETRVKDVISTLENGVDDVRMIGIKGMGGSGKTALARAVYDHVFFWFEGFSFVENIREVSIGSFFGLKELQKQILSDVLNDKSIDVKSVYEGKNMMKKMMPSRKVLLVLDDVDHVDQLSALAGSPNWFKPGSRIIITTRDKQVLVAHGIHNDYIHDVSLLSYEEAICLFSRYAFGRENPVQGYKELSEKVVHYAAGLPLTIKVLGSSLYGRSECEWADAIERLETFPLKKILEILELSYNGLEDEYKEIFLEVACILKGEKKNKAIRILESCGFHAYNGLMVLEQKSLISISNDGRLLLHDLIEEMGMRIVRRLYPDEPYRHSRLWIKEEIEDVLVNNLGTKATRSLKLEGSDLNPAVIMKGLIKMKELRFLYVDDGFCELKIDEVGQYLPNTLQCLHWSRYPFLCLPKTFQAYKLVNLEMVGSNMSHIWELGERKVLNKLKFLDLRFSKLRTFDLVMTPHLETLHLAGCEDFVELHMPFKCPNLKFLNLSGSKVCNLNLGLIPNLVELYLEECNDFVEIHMPFECPYLKFLNLSGSKVNALNLGLTPNLETLDLRGCNDVVLHVPVELPNLKSLNLSGSMLSNFYFGLTAHLEILTLSIKDIKRLPDSIYELKKLKYLELRSCRHLKKLPKDINRLECLEELHLTDCISLRDIPDSICNIKCLKYLHLPYCSQVEKLPEELGSLECLKELNIVGTGIDLLPQSIFKLNGLRIIGSRWQLESYGLSSLKEISAYTASCYI